MNPDITSPSNERIKAAVRLRDRDERDRTGLTVADGIREIGRALDAGASIETAFVASDLLTAAGEGLVDRLGRAAGTTIVTTTEAAFRKIAFGDRIEGVVAVIRQPDHALANLSLRAEPLVVVLEAVEKPGNLGAVLRSADGAGADALIAADPVTDLFNPNTIRASIGTVFSVPIATGDSAAVRDFLAEHGLRLVVARPDAADEYTGVDLRGPVAIVLGSEASGLSAAWAGPDVIPVRLPMEGVADSLNVSIAAAVLLYEARRQRQS
jgi:TrmH family RNA methyltransferase